MCIWEWNAECFWWPGKVTDVAEVCHRKSLHVAAGGEAAIWATVNLISPLSSRCTSLHSLSDATQHLFAVNTIALFLKFIKDEEMVRNGNAYFKRKMNAVIFWGYKVSYLTELFFLFFIYFFSVFFNMKSNWKSLGRDENIFTKYFWMFVM